MLERFVYIVSVTEIVFRVVIDTYFPISQNKMTYIPSISQQLTYIKFAMLDN